MGFVPANPESRIANPVRSEQCCDVVDVRVHRATGGVRVAAAERSHDVFVAADRSLRAAFLLERQGARFEEQRVERLHRSEEHTSELQSRGLISYAVFCLKK